MNDKMIIQIRRKKERKIIGQNCNRNDDDDDNINKKKTEK